MRFTRLSFASSMPEHTAKELAKLLEAPFTQVSEYVFEIGIGGGSPDIHVVKTGMTAGDPMPPCSLTIEVDDLSSAVNRIRSTVRARVTEMPGDADIPGDVIVSPGGSDSVEVILTEASDADWHVEAIETSSGRIAAHHFGAGKGAPLIVLHGAATATEAETAPLIRTLASRFRTVGLDLPGHGKSAYPPASLSIRDFSDEIHDAILALSSEPVHIVGVSMGAAIGLEICRQQAHSVRSLTMIAPTDAWTRQRVQRMRRRLSIDRIIRNPFMVERLSVIHGDHWAELFNDLDRLIESLEGSEYAADELRNVDTPTLIVAWDRDPLFGIEPALRLANEIPYSRLCVLPGSNHSLSSRSAWRLGAFIDDFLSEC